MAKRQPLAIQAVLSLALGISASFTLVVAAAPATNSMIVESLETPNAGRKKLSPSDKAKLRASIKKAMTGLIQLNEIMSSCCELITSGEHISMQAIKDEPFSQIAQTFREMECAMADKWDLYLDAPTLASEVKALRKELATARSRAAQNAMMLKQRLVSPVIVESTADMDGLRELAEGSTQRLHQLVG